MICQAKRRFRTRRAAEDRADQIFRNGGPKMRAYPCGNHYHLTHLPFWKVISGSDEARRQIAAEQGREIAAQENVYLRRRLAEIGEEIQDYYENLILEAFQESLDRRRQAQIRRLLGIPD